MNNHERREIPLERLWGMDVNLSPIKHAMRLWRAGAPLTGLKNSTLIDVSDENPANWRFSLYAGINYGDLTGQTLFQFPSLECAKLAMGQYMDCKEFVQPSACHAEDFGELPRNFVRALFPIKNKRGKVTQLLSAFSHIPLVPGGRLPIIRPSMTMQ